MPIPNGYRLLTSADVGKVFGVDLENVIYFDTSVRPVSGATRDVVTLTNFAEQTNEMGEVEVCYITTNGILGASNTSVYEFGTWKQESIEMDSAFNVNVTSYNTDVEWNNWLYVKDIANPYNITSTKTKITINCKDKLMTKDLTITRELWDGSYEEIVSGFTLTINTSTDGIVISGIYYSLDNGVSWNEITLEALTIENVSQIKIKSEFNFGMLNIGTTEGGSDIYSSLGYQAETDNITLDKDTTIYITNIGYPDMP